MTSSTPPRVIPAVIPGAESQSWTGTNGCGALVLHGFTGSTYSMRPLATVLANAGFSVEMPRLPGHGTTVDDMMTTTWDDWATCAIDAHDRLAAATTQVVVVGLSMGGTLAAWVAAHRPSVAGVALINPAVEPPATSFIEMMEQALASGVEQTESIGSDIKKEGGFELGYDATPVAPMLSLLKIGTVLNELLPSIACPSVVLTSVDDHVVPPSASDHWEARVSGPVERVMLHDSFHVATLDNDAALVESTVLAFTQRVCGTP